MTLDEFLASEACDVPISVHLTDGTRIIFRCDGSNLTELTGTVVGANVFLQFTEIVSLDILTEEEYKVRTKNHEVHWYR